MKKVIFVLFLLGLTNVAVADVLAIGVDENGSVISDQTENLYVVHGGCREYNNNKKLTDIWLYLSRTPNVEYDPNQIGHRILRAQVFLDKEFRSDLSIAVCNGLRKATQTQKPVQAILKPHPYWQAVFIVRILKTLEVDAIDITRDPELLGNFSKRDSDNNCKK